MFEIFLGIALCTFMLGLALEMSPLGKLLSVYVQRKQSVSSCEHAWGIDRITYAKSLSMAETTFLEPGEPRERALHGCTTIAEMCSRCSDRRETTLLGKQIPIIESGTWTGVRPS